MICNKIYLQYLFLIIDNIIPSSLCEGSLEHQAWSGHCWTSRGGVLELCFVRRGACGATRGTVRAPRTTSERPLGGLLEEVLAGPGLGNWSPRRPSTRVHWEAEVGRHAVNLVTVGQSGCSATWPVWGGRALFSSGDLGGTLDALSGTVCLDTFLLPATFGPFVENRWRLPRGPLGWGSLTCCPLRFPPWWATKETLWNVVIS